MRTHREILYGLGFGLGASAIDVGMHAWMRNVDLVQEVLHPELVMVFYRVLFIAFGLALGWLLWRKSERERQFRRLLEVLDRFHRQIVGPAVIIHTNLQMVLMKDEPQLQGDVARMIRVAYEQSQQIQAAAKENLTAAERQKGVAQPSAHQTT